MLNGIIGFIKGVIIAYYHWNLTYGRTILDYLHSAFDQTFYFFLYITIVFTAVYLVLSVLSFFPKKKYRELPFDFGQAPFVTIQIPTRNENIALRCAERCLEFDYPKDTYEILIGDDSNDVLVSQQLQEFAEKHDLVNVIKRKENIGFKPGNLNNMLKHSKGDIIVIFDSDFTPDKDFLKRIVAPFVHDKKVSAVQARWNFNNFNQNTVTVLASTIVYVFHYIMLSFMSRFKTGSLCGSAEAIKKEDLIKLGRWQSGSLTEDVEYSLRLHKNGKKIVYLEDLECYSDVPFNVKDLYKQQMRWAYGVVAAYLLHTKDIVINKSLSLKQKILTFCAGFGYLLPILIMILFIFGTFSLVTDRPAPFDLPRFFAETSFNIILTSGLIVASVVALYKAKKIQYTFRMLISSFSIGIVTTFYVNQGIFKSILRKPMDWYLLHKNTA